MFGAQEASVCWGPGLSVTRPAAPAVPASSVADPSGLADVAGRRGGISPSAAGDSARGHSGPWGSASQDLQWQSLLFEVKRT